MRHAFLTVVIATVLSTLACLDAHAWPTVYPTGVTVHKTDKCSPGYLLEFQKRRIPVLIDMNGEIVHRWSNVSGIGRMYLLPNGNLVLIAQRNRKADDLPPGQDEPQLVKERRQAWVQEVDWDGKEVWRYSPPGRPHHDFKRLPNGNTLIIYAETVPADIRAKASDPKRRATENMGSDVIVEVNPKGKTVWEWRECEHLDINVYSHHDALWDWTHTNAVQALPSNKWFDAGDTRFRPGNVLISVRNHNTIYIIDKQTKKIVWDYTGTYLGGLAHQHEPHMIEPGLPGAGNILIFDNGFCTNAAHDGRTVILEIDPSTKNTVWKYEDGHDFFSATAGAQQRLPNGNTLITASTAHRVFEVTPAGEVVWEWVPEGYYPMRPNRYPYDYCPQMKELPRSANTPAAPPLR